MLQHSAGMSHEELWDNQSSQDFDVTLQGLTMLSNFIARVSLYTSGGGGSTQLVLNPKKQTLLYC